jgi:hypothetical protein
LSDVSRAATWGQECASASPTPPLGDRDHRRLERLGERDARFLHPLGGLVPLFMIQLGEVIYGGSARALAC